MHSYFSVNATLDTFNECNGLGNWEQVNHILSFFFFKIYPLNYLNKMDYPLNYLHDLPILYKGKHL